jgi:hypothetical protein
MSRNNFTITLFRRIKRLLSAGVIADEEEKTANGKIQKEPDQREAQPDGA